MQKIKKKIVFVKNYYDQIKNFVGVALCAFDLLPEQAAQNYGVCPIDLNQT